MTVMNPTLSSSSSLVERALKTVARLIDAAAVRHAQRRVYHETLSELYNLSARELADLGLHRSQLHGIALEAATKHQPR